MIDVLALDALLYAATAAVLTLSIREFRLFNLAAGTWLVLGGWIATVIAGGSGGRAIVSIPALVVLLLLAVAQTAAPYVIRNERLASQSTLYLLASLGVSLAMSSLGTGWLLETSGATIPLVPSNSRLVLFSAAALAAVTASHFLPRSQRFSRLVLRTRAVALGDRDRVASGIAVVVGGELIALMALGGLGFFLHRGLFGTAEHRTLIPLLSILVVRGGALPSAALAFLTVLGSHLATAYLPAWAGQQIPVAIGLLVVLAFLRHVPRHPLIESLPLESYPFRSARNLLGDTSIQGMLTLVLIAITGAIFFPISPQLPQRVALVAVLATVAAVGTRVLGVFSVGWLSLGTLGSYLLAADLGAPVVAIGLVVLVSAFSCYFLLLRLLPTDSALVLDLGSFAFWSFYLRSGSSVVGAQNVRRFRLADLLGNHPELWLLLLTVVGVGVLALLVGYYRSAIGRGIALGLVNFQVGFANRLRPVGAACALSATLVLSTLLAVATYHMVFTSVTPADLDIGIGLQILLLGVLVDLLGPAAVYVAIFVLFGILERLLAGSGVFVSAGLGLSLVVTGLGLPRLRNLHARS